MEDRELLELAAKAAGIRVSSVPPFSGYNAREGFYELNMDGSSVISRWNPLTDDGDALRLAVKLGLQYEFDCLPPTNNDATRKPFRVRVWSNGWQKEDLNNDPYTATRRAIVRAAAEIGKEMK